MQQALARRGCTGIVVTRTLVSNTRLRPCRAVATKAAAKDNVFIPPWKDVFRTLKESGLRTISPEEASELLNSGTWVLLDVRRPDQHEESHPQGSVSVPMYSLIDMSKPDFAKVMKVIAYSFNGVQAIESNTDFTQNALAAAGGKKLITMCEAGGTMRQTVNFPTVPAEATCRGCLRGIQRSSVAACTC
eukprot:GHRR01014329.1.p1 GENE.GHRR01014329.1~~GHRR01014329.1.p1  ORF type:complete len:189 (+),score=36.33 GHRR01014329.1:351-917(+)